MKRLGDSINWEFFEESFDELYSDGVGRPPLATRLMVGIHYLKHSFNLSDEDCCEEFRQNPYWQYFCGLEFFEHEVAFDRSSLTKWRQRLGPEKMEELLKESFQVALRSKFVGKNDVQKVVVDTTVQEKAISFPTDSKLHYKAIVKLAKLSKEAGINLRQSYVFVSKKMLFKSSRYSHAKQMKRAKKCRRKLKTYLGRLIRDIERKLSGVTCSDLLREKLKALLVTSRRVWLQQRKDKGKIYSMHEPSVDCIGKGKAHKKYEFGCKVSVATTLKNSWIVGAQALHGNPFDGHTLQGQVEQLEKLTGLRPEEVFVDQGYRGAKHHPEGMKTHVCGKKSQKQSLKKSMKRRSSIEPIIGHLKSDHGMDRNYLKGQAGDSVNALLAASGKNLRKWMNEFLCVFFAGRKSLQTVFLSFFKLLRGFLSFQQQMI